ncbi:MAG: serine hydrolase [Planctomycetales bacterium]|nr:serine hydrolase [Planctomycetales bacterium]
MRMIVSLIVLATLLCANSRVRGDEKTFVEQSNQYFRRATSEKTSGAVVLIARNGHVLYEAAFGQANIDEKLPLTSETQFRIGSITKQFIAAAVMRLAEAEQLSLDDPLTMYVPNFPGGDNIVLRQLLTHTSGLHSYTERPEFYSRVTLPISAPELIEWFQNDAPDFSPGQKFHYCNSGYFLLGEIASKVSGKPLAEYLQSVFFEPLGMDSTGIYENSLPPKRMAVGYSFVEGEYQFALDWDMSWAGGAGAMYSTIHDLNRWNEALHEGKVLSSASYSAATTPVKLPEGEDGMSYGYGLVVNRIKRLPVIGHSGGLNGWSCDLRYFPEQHTSIVVLTNSFPSHPTLSPQTITHLLAENFLADEISKLPPIQEDDSLDQQSLLNCIGRYDYSGAVMEVTLDGKQLYAQLTDQPKFPIYARTKDEFFWKIVDAEVTFLRDEQGNVNAARHTQNGASFTAPKLTDVLQISEAQLDKFVGEYQYGPEVVMKVTRDGPQLFARITGQPKLPIFAKTATEFAWRVVEASVEFLTDESGNVVKCRHNQNGISFEAPRIMR